MTETNLELFETFIESRLEIALNRLKTAPHFEELHKKQEERAEIVNELLHKLEKEERIAIRRYYDTELSIKHEKTHAAYIQGLSDCIHMLAFLGVFTSQTRL